MQWKPKDLRLWELGVGLRLALCGAALQIASLLFPYYDYQGQTIGAWSGIPHTAHLLILSGASVLTATLLIARGRSMFAGRRVTLILLILGGLATAQVGYRMVAAPFDAEVPAKAMIIGRHCMYYCWPSEAKRAVPLAGLWIALAGSVLVAGGGLLARGDRRTRQIAENFWRSPDQTGLSPWLALLALLSAGQFVFGFTFFAFYSVVRDGGVIQWSGWLAMPHTGALVLLVTLTVCGLAGFAAVRRAPMTVRATGLLIASLATVSTAWTALRIVRPPFSRGPVDLEPAAYVSVLCGLFLVGLALAYSARE